MLVGCLYMPQHLRFSICHSDFPPSHVTITSLAKRFKAPLQGRATQVLLNCTTLIFSRCGHARISMRQRRTTTTLGRHRMREERQKELATRATEPRVDQQPKRNFSIGWLAQ